MQELAALGAGSTIVDVREPDEWREAHIAHATLVPLQSVPDRVDAFVADPTYVICRVGGRSASACEFLISRGASVVNVTGGMIAWTAAGFETESGHGTTGG